MLRCIRQRVVTTDKYSPQNSFAALYRSFTECVFVEEEGDIVFYKNSRGEAARQLAEGVLRESSGEKSSPGLFLETTESDSESDTEQAEETGTKTV